MQGLCLSCHGEKYTEIKADVLEVIQQKYPGDLAFNYKEGDLRGVWHLVYKAKKLQND